MVPEAETYETDLPILALLRDRETGDVIGEVRAQEHVCPGCLARGLRDILAEIEEWA